MPLMFSSQAVDLLQVLPEPQLAPWCGACRYSICNQPVESQDPSPGHVRKVQARFLELHKVLDIKVTCSASRARSSCRAGPAC